MTLSIRTLSNSVWLGMLGFCAAGLPVLLTLPVKAQATFPASEWTRTDPARLGWSIERLAAAEVTMREIGSTSVMVVQNGQVVAQWGEVTRRVRIASVRKSILSALFGPAIADGKIKRDQTLAEIGIDDQSPRLTPQEKSATVRDLLKSRSGVFHLAAAESENQIERRPPAGSAAPGTLWYYNNWDFNALGTIYRKLTGEDIFEAVERRLAKPIGMQDFTASDGRYVKIPKSVHPAYHMNMSARDLARFGLLFLNKGRWNERPVLSSEWVAESTHPYSVTNRRIGYGYMWWVSESNTQFGAQFGPGSYSARGYGGQVVLVAPAHDLVIVHLTDAYLAEQQYTPLLGGIIAAAPARR